MTYWQLKRISIWNSMFFFIFYFFECSLLAEGAANTYWFLLYNERKGRHWLIKKRRRYERLATARACHVYRWGWLSWVLDLWGQQKMTPYPVHPQKWTIDLLFKNNKIYSLKTIESTNTWQISRPPPFLPCARHKCMAPMHAINIHFYMHSYNYTTLFLTFLMQTKRDQKGNLIQYLTYQRQDTLRSRFTIIYSRCNVKERGQGTA